MMLGSCAMVMRWDRIAACDGWRLAEVEVSSCSWERDDSIVMLNIFMILIIIFMI